MRPGPATRAALFRGIPGLLFTAAKRRYDAHPSATLKKRYVRRASCTFSIARSRLYHLLLPAAHSLKEQSGKAATPPGHPQRTHARLWKVPPATHPRKSPTAAGFAAIIRQAQKLSRWMHSLCGRLFCTATTKRIPFVQKLWTIDVICGKSWKT
jgi:hypothetical protein